MLLYGALLVSVLFLAYGNGANDNLKGVATLLGRRATDYRRALLWATLTTFAGSASAMLLSGGLLAAFSGKGLVPDALTADVPFLTAVGFGAAATVIIATAIGAPVSTTHALTGALIGAGLIASGSVDPSRLTDRFVLPLAVSPVVSLVATVLVYRGFSMVRNRLGVRATLSLSVAGQHRVAEAGPDGRWVFVDTGAALSEDEVREAAPRYEGAFLRLDAQALLTRLHFASAGLTSFARGLNDTPKIAALLAAASGLGLPASWGFVLVGVAIAIGGLLSARRVAVTMSEKVTAMNQGQGFSANLVTAVLGAFASKWGLPVSTTHVSCGSLFGVGVSGGQARWRAITAIILAWVVTLPMGMACAAVFHLVLGGRGV